MSPLHSFAEAFNGADLPALASLLVPDATAKVLGSDYPEEQGRDVIERTSLPHLLDPAAALQASVVIVEGEEWILLRQDGGQGAIDAAIRSVVREDRIERLEYVVGPHQPAWLRGLGVACGLPTVADE